jgi:hypothetical protein
MHASRPDGSGLQEPARRVHGEYDAPARGALARGILTGTYVLQRKSI